MLQYLTAALKGTAQARVAHQDVLSLNPSILTGIKQLEAICPADDGDDDDDDEEPIFLLSAGWRSGSTLLQRLIMSDSNVFMWGEPYDECGLIQALAETVKAFRPGWPPREYYYDGTPPSKLSGSWIANLFPAPEDLRKGYRALIHTMFAEPAKRAGATRWGIKEVRLGAEHAFFLRWLYPKARFVFLYRNPLDAYRSYCRYGRNWYDTFPDKPMFTPTAFGRHWRKLAEGFLMHAELLNALVIRYEDLVGGHARLDEIEQYLGIRMDRSLLQSKVGSSERRGEQAWISRLEKWLLWRAVAPAAHDLNYKW